MINWLTGHPGLVAALNCCVAPVGCFALGLAAAAFSRRYRVRFRAPWTTQEKTSLEGEL